MTTESRLMSHVEVDENGCWLWTGYCHRTGYGEIGMPTPDRGYRSRFAHRVSYQLFVGPIPEGLELDHLCRVRRCINPEHLEPVTRRENIARGQTQWARMWRDQVCDNGHDLTLPNAWATAGKVGAGGHMRCRKCWNKYMRDYKRKRKAALA